MHNRSVQQYVTALSTTPQLPFKHLKDRNFKLVYTDNNKPVRFSGSSSVVFKITDGEKFYALKCYITELFNRWEYLDKVRQEIKTTGADWIVPFDIFKNEMELTTDEGRSEPCNLILMPWIDGNRLTDLVKQYTSNYKLHDRLKELTGSIRELANRQVGQPFSHGDISPENIMVTRTGEMVLLDHDSYYFESCQAMAGRGGWSLAYQHPNRHPLNADLQADHFSFLTLTLSLKAIELNPGLFQQFNSSKGLLFTIDDYRNPEYSKVFDEIKKIEDPYLQHLLGILIDSLKTREIEIPGLLQHLNGPGYSPIQPVFRPAKNIEDTAIQEEPAHPAVQPFSSLVINEKGMIAEQNTREEIMQHQPAENTGQAMPVLQPVNQLIITDAAHEKKRKKSRIAIAAILSTVLLVLLGIKAFFPETKFVTPVDYKNLGARVKPGNAGNPLAKENQVPDELGLNNIEKPEPFQSPIDSADFFTGLTKEINNAVAIGLAQSNSNAGDKQRAKGNGPVTKTRAVKKTKPYTKRKSDIETVSFRKINF